MTSPIITEAVRVIVERRDLTRIEAAAAMEAIMSGAATDVQIAAFLTDHPGWTIDAARAEELPAGIAPNEQGFVRTLPGLLAEAGGLDGFFIARLRAPS